MYFWSHPFKTSGMMSDKWVKSGLGEGQLSANGGVEGGWPGRSASQLDGVDRAIIAELLRDGRISMRTLAERVHISRANAYARVERLSATGVITGFTVTVDPLKMGLATSAYVTLSLRQSSWRTLRKQLQEIPEIKHMALVGGDFDAILLVRAADNEGLRRVVLEKLQAIPEVLATRTALIFEDVGTL